MRTVNIENREEIDQLIRSCKTCFLSLCVDDIPYVVPMNFALDGDTIIIHSAQSGRKWEMLQKNPRVCINWTLGEKLAWQNPEVGCSYRVKSRTVIVEGIAEFVEDIEEKANCLKKIMAHYSTLDFKFNTPSVRNVGVIKIHIQKISAKKFGAKAPTPWNRNEPDNEE
jgi:uncharacterized protein